MNIAKTPRLVKSLFSKLTWQIFNETNTIYLTFDDGPVPGVTEWVLDILKEYSIKASFFCVGENVSKHPEIFERIKREGHSVGNHTFNHLNGWKCDLNTYLDNIKQADELIDSKLFRPPHGRIRHKAISELMPRYEIVMWDVLSIDYNAKIDEKTCIKNVLQNVQPGSIIVFHDSYKAEKNLKAALPKCIEALLREGYNFSKIEAQ